mmetsp:Transcript_14524/g.29239  ORF Transcript_14524/g.29239 Transcript_14524/m.29239 type:complete len:141 (+) Transcript_14524:495-917(+)
MLGRLGFSASCPASSIIRICSSLSERENTRASLYSLSDMRLSCFVFMTADRTIECIRVHDFVPVLARVRHGACVRVGGTKEEEEKKSMEEKEIVCQLQGRNGIPSRKKEGKPGGFEGSFFRSYARSYGGMHRPGRCLTHA